MTDYFNPDILEKLIITLASAGAGEFELSDGEKQLKIKFSRNDNLQPELKSTLHSQTVAQTLPQPVSASGFKITAPLSGVFYAAPAPNDPPYTQVGKKVSKGDVLCIIEAMKMMNEIESDVSGTVKGINVKNADVVEAGDILFVIEKD